MSIRDVIDRAPLGRFQILIIAVLMGAALFATAFALNIDDGGTFVSFIAFLGTFVAVLFPVLRTWTELRVEHTTSPVVGSVAQVWIVAEPPGVPRARA